MTAIAAPRLAAATVPATGAPPTGEAAVVLSPFQVNEANDVGYLAGASVSGSRFNTRLKDISAQVAVFTPEFIMDLGANNLEEVMRFSANFQTDVGDTAVDMNGAAGVDQDASDTRFRIRNISGSRALDFFESHIVNDNYNVGRFEAVSGPNAILFGFGSAGGVVNTTSKRALTSRHLFTYRLQVGSWEKLRNEVDANYALIRDKLGLRLMGLQESANSWRKWGYDEQQRGTAALTYQPFRDTAIRALYEKGHSERHYEPATLSLYDGLALWTARGRTIKEGYNAAADRPNGITQITGAHHLLVENTGAYYDAQNLTTSSFENLALPVTQRAGLTLLPTSQFPADVSATGPGAKVGQDFHQGRVFLEQQVGDRFTVELAYNKMWNYDEEFAPQGTSPALTADTSLTLPGPGGTRVPNPHAGRLFIEGSWLYDTIFYDIDSGRATLAYDLELGKWFGHHKPAMLLQTERTLLQRRIHIEIPVEANGVPLANVVPDNTTNVIFRRRYISEGAFDTYYQGDAPNVPFQQTINGRPYTRRWVTRNQAGSNRSKISTDTLMLATQSYFWRDRLNVLFGYRRDALTRRRFTAERVPAGDPRIAAGARLLNEWDFGRAAETQKFTPTTRSLGGVFHVTKHVALSYNESSNVGQPILNATIIPDASNPPATSGQGSDWGVIFDLFDGRVFLRVNRYETSSFNRADGAAGIITTPSTRILDTLRTRNLINQTQYDEHLIAGTMGLSDSYAKGVEVSLTANPLRNWALQANYSYNNQAKRNYFTEAEAVVVAEENFWLERIRAAGLTATNISTGGLAGSVGTVADEIAQIHRSIQMNRDAAELGYGKRPHKANLFTRYTFTEGRILKGVLFGGGLRYQSASFNQRDPATGRDYWGESLFKVDALVGYRRRLAKFFGGKPLDLSVQLNVTNVLNDADPLVGRLNDFYNAPRRIYYQEPRNFRLTTTVTF
jgi:iron complex outermembrane recepter protein